jgi:hypothetical protein
VLYFASDRGKSHRASSRDKVRHPERTLPSASPVMHQRLQQSRACFAARSSTRQGVPGHVRLWSSSLLAWSRKKSAVGTLAVDGLVSIATPTCCLQYLLRLDKGVLQQYLTASWASAQGQTLPSRCALRLPAKVHAIASAGLIQDITLVCKHTCAPWRSLHSSRLHACMCSEVECSLPLSTEHSCARCAWLSVTVTTQTLRIFRSILWQRQ